MSTTATSVAESNTAQLDAWDGGEGQYWAAHADEYDDSITPYHHALLDLAAVEPDDRVLDIGCGTGQTTRDAARLAVAGSAVGIDLSWAMLEVAGTRAEHEGVRNVSFLVRTPRCTRSSRRPSTWRSVGRARCSSASRRWPTRTSPAPCVREAASPSRSGRRGRRTSGSRRSPAPSPRGGTCRSRHRTRHTRSR